MLKAPNRQKGFTIVELLVVIVVIGILAAITIVSYNGISQRANIASLQSDLASAANMIKMYRVDNSVYPNNFDINNCPDPADPRYCLKPSVGNSFNYQLVDAQSFVLKATRNSTTYQVNQDSSIELSTGIGGIDANTKLMLHGDDLSDAIGKSITNTGSVTVNTTTKKIGTGSLQFNGTNYLSIPYNSDFDFGSGNFTVDFWVYPTVSVSIGSLVSFGEANSATSLHHPWGIQFNNNIADPYIFSDNSTNQPSW